MVNPPPTMCTTLPMVQRSRRRTTQPAVALAPPRGCLPYDPSLISTLGSMTLNGHQGRFVRTEIPEKVPQKGHVHCRRFGFAGERGHEGKVKVAVKAIASTESLHRLIGESRRCAGTTRGCCRKPLSQCRHPKYLLHRSHTFEYLPDAINQERLHPVLDGRGSQLTCTAPRLNVCPYSIIEHHEFV